MQVTKIIGIIFLVLCAQIQPEENQDMIGIIFDCDGTLVDSERAHFLSWKHAYEKRGGSLTEEDYCNYIGRTVEYISNSFHSHVRVDSAEHICRDKNDKFHEFLAVGIPPVERTLKFVRYLAERKKELNIKLAVASAAQKSHILRYLVDIGIDDVFDVILSGMEDLGEYQDPEGVNKPKPYIYQHAVKLLGLKPDQCVAFEDSQTGLLAAVRAGLITFAVPNKFTENHDFSLATFLIKEGEEISAEDFFQKVQTQIDLKTKPSN